MREFSLDVFPSSALVAERIGLSRQAVRRPLRDLEERELVERGASHSDRRRSPLRLTPTGEALLLEALTLIEDAEHRFMGDAECTSQLDLWLEQRVRALRPRLKPPDLREMLRWAWGRAINCSFSGRGGATGLPSLSVVPSRP